MRARLLARRRDERGAAALITAFTCVVMFGIAALSVDLGNAFARRTDTQTQADYGALAAARMQTETAKAGMTIPSNMVDAVRDAMNRNQPQDDAGTCWTAKTCVTSAQLTDGDLTNGEVRFCSGTTCGAGYATTMKGLQVVGPRNKVDYGFANLLGVSSGSVQGDALVNVFTAGMRVMPMYAVQGCDYGLQTLVDPANGQATPVVPTTLSSYNDNGQNNLTFNQTTAPLSPLVKNWTGATVSAVALNSTDNTVTIEGKWRNLTDIGFFRSDGSAPTVVAAGPATVGIDPAVTGLVTPYTNAAGARLSLKIPDSVATVAEVWWIRARGSDGKWSKGSESLPLRVGGAVLECASGSTSGNFGTLKFPRTDVPPANYLPANIANGLQPPLTPTVHSWALANPTLAGICSDGVNGAKTAPSGSVTLVSGVNCVDTDTGLPASVATEGLVAGGTYGSGLLGVQSTKAGCDPTGGSANRVLPITGSPSINDDVLTCYFTNGTTSIADISSASYSGGVALDTSILRSPRFFWVPVLAVQPAEGGSDFYSIVDFRPAFITDEVATTAAVKGSHTGTSNNGLAVQGNDIKQIKVVFFNDNALPVDGDIPVIDYLGTGNRVIRLID